ncbi:hypothetical protein SAMN06298226_1421 [Nitrosovibrio sp. Nv4]|nr:hypothetical protein SAMN06298226_1421 [Nitrosovibrio sp. Nv4]
MGNGICARTGDVVMDSTPLRPPALILLHFVDSGGFCWSHPSPTTRPTATYTANYLVLLFARTNSARRCAGSPLILGNALIPMLPF